MSEEKNRAINLVADALSKDAERARDYLRGIDIEASIQKNISYFERIKQKARLQKAGDRFEQLEEKLSSAKKRIRARLEQLSITPEEIINRLLDQQGKDAYQLHFRNIEDLDADDALDMLEETELLKLLDELDEMNDL